MLTARRVAREKAGCARAELIVLLDTGGVVELATFLAKVHPPLLVHHPQFFHTLSAIFHRVISEMTLEYETLVTRQVTRVNGDTVVIAGATRTDKAPVSVLLSKIETGRVGDECPCEQPPGKPEPAN